MKKHTEQVTMSVVPEFHGQTFLALEHLHALKNVVTRGQRDVLKLANLAEQYGLQNDISSTGMIHKMELQIMEQLRRML